MPLSRTVNRIVHDTVPLINDTIHDTVHACDGLTVFKNKKINPITKFRLNINLYVNQRQIQPPQNHQKTLLQIIVKLYL